MIVPGLIRNQEVVTFESDVMNGERIFQFASRATIWISVDSRIPLMSASLALPGWIRLDAYGFLFLSRG